MFDVKPWTQFFDLQGHEPPRSVVRNVVLRNLTGSVRSLGELRGNPGDVIENIILDDVYFAAERLRTDADAAITLKVVKINGEPYTLPNQ